MADENIVTVKVVTQKIHLEYTGTATTTSNVAAKRMSKLLGLNSEGSQNSSSEQSTTKVWKIFDTTITNETPDIGPVHLEFEPVLTALMDLNNEDAVVKKNEFFTAVETGKKALREKFGDKVPNSAILDLAQKVSSKAVTIWKTQIITTRNSATPFEGGHQTRDGRYSATVKSKTIYTWSQPSDEQINLLADILSGKTGLREGSIARSSSKTVAKSGYSTWDDESGKLIFREDRGRPTSTPSVG